MNMHVRIFNNININTYCKPFGVPRRPSCDRAWALLGVQTLVSAGLSKAAWNLPGVCAEGLVAYYRRVWVPGDQKWYIYIYIFSTILNSEFQVTQSHVLSTILSSRCQKVMYCCRFWFPGVRKWCAVTDSEFQVSKSVVLSTSMSSRCQKVLYCLRLCDSGVKKWCAVDDYECQVPTSVVLSTIRSGSR